MGGSISVPDDSLLVDLPKAETVFQSLLPSNHPRVSHVRIPPSRNLFFTDSNSVFAKLSREDLQSEYEGAQVALGAGVPTPRVLMPPVAVQEGFLLAYEWHPTRGGYGSPVEALHTLRQVPVPAEARPLTSSSKLSRALTGLRSVEQTDLARDLASLGEEMLGDIERLEQEVNPCFLHGDFHNRNLLATADGQPLLLDWEMWGVGPQETDISKWVASSLAENHLTMATMLGTFRWAEKQGYSVELIDAGIRAIGVGAATYHLRYGPDSIVATHARIASLGLQTPLTVPLADFTLF